MSDYTNKFPPLDSMRIKNSTCLDHSIFNSSNVRIVGQAHSQVIFVVLFKPKLLLVFDQHAVHERIRYERLLANAFDSVRLFTTRKVMPPVEYQLSPEVCDKIRTHQCLLEKWFGLQIFVPKPGKVCVSQVPACFKNFANENMFKDFISETINQIDMGKISITEPVKLTPFLLEQIKTQACRGAIRFGETLSRPSSDQLIKSLTLCKFCFRCAHGRVLVKPIVYIPVTSQDDDDIEYRQKLKREFSKTFPPVDIWFQRKI